MKRRVKFGATIVLSATVAALVACNGIPGSESGDLAPSRPVSQVSGFVVDDAISDALINVYAFDNGVKGELLASTTTAADGSYSLAIDAVTPRPVLFEARGGSYVELATGEKVSLKEDEVLKAVAIQHPGQPLSIMVTPLTHLVTALVEYQLASGMSVDTAIATATAEIDELFGFDVAATYPHSIAEQGADADLSAERLYAFFLSALSSWTKRVSEQNGLPPHSTYNSIELSQVLYNEVASDGLLDGKGKASGSNNSTQLALGVVGLNPNAYRISLAQHMLAMAASSANNSGIGVDTLLPLAYRFVNSRNRIFAGAAPELVGDRVEVSANENLGNYRRGVFEYAVTLGSPELISSVSFHVDDFELPLAVVPGEMKVPIDTRQFPDGEHTITMVAKDWLGNQVASVSSSFQFDNTDPFINVSSSLYTNKQNYVLSGTLGDNGSGIQLFEIQGQPVNINPDNTWSFDLPLAPGNNSVSIRLLDWADNGFDQEVNIVLDQTAPVVDTSAGHGPARFSDTGGQIISAAMTDENVDKPLYLETDKLDLDGIAITRSALETNLIPYFAFKVNDPITSGVSTEAGSLNVSMRYEKNGVAISDWRSLTLVAAEYLVPLTSETLASGWDQTVPEDEHVVRVRVTDRAGNVGEKVLSFKADIVVSDFPVTDIQDLNAALFNNTSFSQRSTLNNKTFSAIGYSFTNITGKAIYVQPSDGGGHVAEQVIEKLVREHKVRLKTSTDWQIGVSQNAVNFCDGDFNEIFWKNTVNPAVVYNYSAGQWQPMSRPEPVLGAIQDVFSDTPVPPEPDAWSDVADFDADFASFALTVSQGIVIFSYDYLLSLGDVLPEPALIMNWQLDKDGVNLRACESTRNFSQRQSYSYVSEPDYPRNTLSSFTEQESFNVADFSVINKTTSSEVIPVNGWYRIPAGHTVTINKRVQTPALTINDDQSVSDPQTVTTYDPLLYDKAITWSVNRELTIRAIHDSGAENIFLMTPKEINAGEGAVVYSISR